MLSLNHLLYVISIYISVIQLKTTSIYFCAGPTGIVHQDGVRMCQFGTDRTEVVNSVMVDFMYFVSKEDTAILYVSLIY